MLWRWCVCIVLVALSLVVSTLSSDSSSSDAYFKASISGFESPSSLNLLRRVLGCDGFEASPLQQRRVLTCVTSNNVKLALSQDIPIVAVNEAASEVSFVNVPASLFMLDDTLLLARLQKAMQSLLRSEAKKNLVVVVTAKSEKSMAAVRVGILDALSEAWAALDKAPFVTENVFAEVNVKVVLVLEGKPEHMTAANKEMLSVLEKVAQEGQAMGLETLFPSPSVLQGGAAAAAKASTITAASLQQSRGLEACQEGTFLALKWAETAASASSLKLQRQDMADSFALFIENLITEAVKKLRAHVSDKAPNASKQVLYMAEQDIKRQIFGMLLPFYKRQVLLARTECSNSFNKAVVDELVVTIDLMQDLYQAKSEALNKFRHACSKLLPRGAPKMAWNFESDDQAFVAALDEYIGNREAGAKSVGVLSRGRKPIDVSFHVFKTHPFGMRDYRQDVLGATKKDTPMYDAELARTREVSVHPSLARAVLVNKLEKDAQLMTTSEKRQTSKQSEFAREMLMFPLSIKNPEVAIMAGRAKKKSSVAAAKRDPMRETLGPERFVRWDLPPLAEARNNMALALKESEEGSSGGAAGGMGSVADKALNLIPFFGSGAYTHPKINYGPKYRSNKASSTLVPQK